MARIIEGFAAVAYAHYPYFAGQSDRIAAPDWAQHSWPVREQTDDGEAWRVVK
jgi:hypothetical protein